MLLTTGEKRLAHVENGKRGAARKAVVRMSGHRIPGNLTGRRHRRRCKAVQYTAQYYPVAAKRTGDMILKKVQLIARFSRLGKVFAGLHRDNVREVPVPPDRVIYFVQATAHTVRILTDWHGAQREPFPLPGL